MTHIKRLKICEILPLVIALFLFYTGTSFAQGTISNIDVTSTFQLTASSFDTTPEANFKTNTIDHVFEQGWWFRVQGSSQESTFPTPLTQSYSGNQSRLYWNDFAGIDFEVEIKMTLLAPASGATSRVQADMTVKNKISTPRTINIFHVLDFDLKGNAAGDSATLVSPNNYIRITDSDVIGEYRAIGASAYLVRPFSSSGTDVPGLLSDTLVTNFDNSGLPFGPSDFTGGFQFVLPLAGGETKSLSVIFAVNEPANLITEACALPNNICSTTMNQPSCETAGGTYYPSATCVDTDGDGRSDLQDSCPVDGGKFTAGTCGCGTPDTDSDGDGTPNCVDSCPVNNPKVQAGVCGCAAADTDINKNGVIDCLILPELKARLNAANSLLAKVKKGKDGKLTKTAKTSKTQLNTLLKDLKSFIRTNSASVSVKGKKSLSSLNTDAKNKITKALKTLSVKDKKAAKDAIKAFLKALRV